MDLTNLNINKDKGKQRRKPTVDLSTMVYGKVPPQDQEAEKAVLGAILNERHAMAEVQDLLKPEKFYLTAHNQIFQAMLNLDARSLPLDLITVPAELTRMEQLEAVGGAYYLVELSKGVVSSANIGAHAKVIAERHISREVIRAGGEMIAFGYDNGTDAFDLLDHAETSLARIMDSNDRGKITPIDIAAVRSWQRITFLRSQSTHMTGVSSGFRDLDKITHGWQNTDLIILAARPAVGKTAFALNLARNAALHQTKPVPVAFFSLEMSEGQLIERLISAESEYYLEQIKTGQLDDNQADFVYKNGVVPISQAPIFIDDTPALNIFELRAKCRRLKNKHNIGFILIDYLQLMSGTGDSRNGNREQEISRISRDLKGLAKELQVPIGALSQLSRAVENRQDKTPQLSDLRESGAIEQDADMVMFLYRPEYYGIKENEQGLSSKGLTEIKIAKHRNGSLDTIKLIAKLDIQKFVDYEEDFSTPLPGPVNTWKQIRPPYADDKDEIQF